MARLDRDSAPPGPIVSGFVGTGFLVQGQVYDGLFLTPERAFAWDAPPPDALAFSDLAPILAIDPPPLFILLGTGPGLRFPPRGLIRALEEQGIGLEAMDSRAAARAWGLLRGEERWIAAALMPLR